MPITYSIDTTTQVITTKLVGALTVDDVRAHFGLGEAGTVEEIEVRWPSGRLQRLNAVKADQVLQVREPSAP